MSALRKGLRLPWQKEPAMSLPIADFTDIQQVTLPYAYTDTAVPSATVSLLDTVSKGSPLCTVDDNAAAATHSSVTGVVSSEREFYHPLHGNLRCAVIDCVAETGDPLTLPPPDTEIPLSSAEILSAAETAGVVDELDGIPFATKLSQWQRMGCDIVVADAVQVQPFESSAWAVLRENAEEIVEGLRLVARCIGVTNYHIAVCLSDRRRRKLMRRISRKRVFQTESYYPVGDLHRHHSTPIGKETKRGELCRVGVQACLALYRAVYHHEPHTHCVLTVAGNAVKHPQNVRVPFGTSVQEVLRRCGVCEDPAHLILGEVMTGTASLTQDIPVLPGMTCLLTFTSESVSTAPARTCIGCGRCVQVCHAGLLPFELHRRLQNLHYEGLATLAADECDGCGACSYVCPCGIDLAASVQEAQGADSTIFLNLEEDTDA